MSVGIACPLPRLGFPLTSGLKAFFYQPGTTTKQYTYTTSSLSVANSNPVQADSNGLFPAVFLDPTLGYKIVIAPSTDSDPPSSPIFTQDSFYLPGSKVFQNTELQVYDTDGDHLLTVKPGSNLTADRTLTVTTGDANRTLTLGGNLTGDQDVSTTASPTFAVVTFASDTDTGIYRIGANNIAVAVNGIKTLEFDSTNFIDSPTQPRGSAYNSAAQTVTAGNTTQLTFDTEVADVGSMFATNALTIGTGADGTYLITVTANASWTTLSNVVLYLHLKKNGTTIQTSKFESDGSSVSAACPTITAVLTLAATDALTVYGQAVTTNVAFGSSTAAEASRVSWVKLW
jgi:hypothetical protein